MSTIEPIELIMSDMSQADDTDYELGQYPEYSSIPLSIDDELLSLSLIPESLADIPDVTPEAIPEVKPIFNGDDTYSQKCRCKKCIIFKKTSHGTNHSLEKTGIDNQDMSRDYNPKRRRMYDYDYDNYNYNENGMILLPVIFAGYIVLPNHIFQRNQEWKNGP